MRKKKDKGSKPSQNNLELKEIEPLTANQERAFDAWDEDQNLVLSGCAGTGKTFQAVYMALEAIKEGLFTKLIILRSAVASRNLGYLPGNAKEKVEVYEVPYRTIVNQLYGRGDAYELLKAKKVIEFDVTSYLRGITISNTIVIVDEFQNMSMSETGTIMTRAGENTKYIFCGDFEQSDLVGREKSETLTFLKILGRMSSFSRIDFEVEDIVRSGLVKEFLIAKREVQDDNGSQHHDGAM